MDLQDFTFGINRLQKFYNKKLNPDQDEEYFQRIKNIPQKVFIRAIDDIIDTSRFFPAPGEFKTYWYQWQVTNPEQIDREVTYCPDCHGEGVLYFKIKPKGATFQNREYEYMVRCGSCENWKGEIGKWVPKKTKQQLESMGLRVIPLRVWDETEDIMRDVRGQVPAFGG